MKKVTLLFPGQGSQYVGMGKNLNDQNLFFKANEVLGFSLSTLCFEGPEEELKQTAHTQPAILTHSVALFNELKTVLKDKGYEIDAVLGHSVGEYAALVAAGSLSFEDAVLAVNLRGKFMQEAVPYGIGAMIAVMRATEEEVISACREASDETEQVMPANFNDPGQIVISGHVAACNKAMEILKTKNDKVRGIELKVSAPFHSTLMKPAAIKLAEAFSKFTFKSPTLSYVANIDAKKYGPSTDAEVIKKNLIDQVAGSVLWTQSVKAIDPNSICIEVGPGKVLQGLVKKINPELKVISLDDQSGGTTGFDKLKEVL